MSDSGNLLVDVVEKFFGHLSTSYLLRYFVTSSSLSCR